METTQIPSLAPNGVVRVPERAGLFPSWLSVTAPAKAIEPMPPDESPIIEASAPASIEAEPVAIEHPIEVDSPPFDATRCRCGNGEFHLVPTRSGWSRRECSRCGYIAGVVDHPTVATSES